MNASGQDLLFAGGLIFTSDGQLEAGRSVLVRDGRVEAIGNADEFAGFTGERVDTTDATLLPGLIDCHVHLLFGAEGNPGRVMEELGPGEVVLRALSNAQTTLAGGITAVRDCGGKDYLEFAVRDACNRRRFPGPTIRAAGRMICMTGGHGNRYGRVADGVDDVVRAVREQVHAGSDFVKIMATGGVMTQGVDPQDAHYSAEEIKAGIDEAKRFRRTTASHAQGTEGILNATRGGVTSIEHGIYLTDECIEEMLARGTYLVPTLAAITNIVENPEADIPAWAMDKARAVVEVHKRSIKTFADAGGRIAMGTDAGTPFNKHGANAQELRHMVEIGMSAQAAMTAATRVAADLLELPEQGRLAVGAQADFLLVNGNPGDDIARVADRTHHLAVYKRGRRFDPQAHRA